MAADISQTLSGILLKTPLIVSAGPLTRDVRSIQRLADEGGIGAVVLKTVYRQPADTPRPYMAKVSNNLLNYDWSATGIDEWTQEKFEQLKDTGLPILASVGDKDDEVLVGMAQVMERLGAAMIEVPTGNLSTPERVRERTSRLRSALRIPLTMKIGSSVPDLESWVRAIEDSGADAITAINTIGPAIAIDIETGKPLIGNIRGYGYLSGPALLPISLRIVADIAAITDLPVMGVGGVEDASGAVQMLMVGAHAVQIHTAGILRGLKVFRKIAAGLAEYLDEHGHETVQSIVGLSQPHLTPERSWGRFLPVVDPESCGGCRICERVCVYEAVTMVDHVPRFDVELCHSCGLCISACPSAALTYGDL